MELYVCYFFQNSKCHDTAMRRAINEEFLHRIIKEEVAKLITESQESKSISQAKRLVMDRLGYDEKEADEFIRIKLRGDIPSLRTQNGGKFILGVARMFCDRQLTDAATITRLNSTLKLVSSDAHVNEYDRNLNGLSAQELIERFAKAMSDNLEAEKEEVSRMTFDSPSDYDIVRIDSFEEAKEYGGFTSWCVTHSSDMFDSYTCDGINQFYFCLRKGFQDEEAVAGDGCPLDSYGLSMIAVSVDEDGMISTCTCRWNLDNGGSEHVMDSKQLSSVLKVNVFDVMKPNNKWKEILSDAMRRLGDGEYPADVFDRCDDFSEGFAKVSLNDKWNFINTKGELLSERWFDCCDDFHKGFAKVMLNGKWNFISTEGELLSEQWFNDCNDFYEGFARVKLNGKWNSINTEGEFLSERWFDVCYSFRRGFARVKLNGKWNFINTEGEFLSERWFDDCGEFREGFAKVQLKDKKNFINTEGELLSERWFDWCDDFNEGFARVQLNGKYNFISTEGELLSERWFDYCGEFREGLAEVLLNGKWYFINTKGELSVQN